MMGIGMWKIFSYIKKGISHSVNQDAVCVPNVQETNGVTIGVLADGLGGLKGQGVKTMSEIASKAVVEAISKMLSHHFDDLEKNPDKVIQFTERMTPCYENEINQKITEHNQKYNARVTISDMDCTLLFVALKGNTAIIGAYR